MKHTLIRRFCPVILFACVYFNNVLAFSLWGQAPDNKLLLGMWTVHLSGGTDRDHVSNNTVGLVYHSAFLATFNNTYGRQSVAGGLERAWVSKQLNSHTHISLGYRLGLIYGYDKRLMPLAGQTPIIPFAQIIADMSYRRVGVEISYTGIVISAGFYLVL